MNYYSNQALPPGYYKYSNHFPKSIKQLSPIYTVPTEPVFMDHLVMNIDKKIQVTTISGTLEGILSGVAIDHIQLNDGPKNYHIRMQHITYFVGMP